MSRRAETKQVSTSESPDSIQDSDKMSSESDILRSVDVTLSLLADFANIGENGKLNVMGVFEVIYASDFPATHGPMSLVLRFQCNSAEFGQVKSIRIVLMNPDGKHLAKVEGSMQIKAGGPEVEFNQIIPLPALLFPEPGDHAFIVTIGDDTKARIPLKVMPLPKEKEDGSETKRKKR